MLMVKNSRISTFIGILCSATILISSCNRNTENNLLLVTLAERNRNNPDYVSGLSWRYIEGGQIAITDLSKQTRLKILTGDFHSACFPEVSYDGKFILFAGQKNNGDPWQIWEMKLRNGKSRKIITLPDDCTDPVYLPGGRVAFSRHLINDTIREGHPVFTCNLDGSNLKQITFYPGNYFATTILKDGRLLTVSRQLFPVLQDPILTVMRPDGTKADMFYMNGRGKVIINRPRETADGKILLIEEDVKDSSENRLISIKYARPLHSRTELSSGLIGKFGAVLPVSPEKYLVSFREKNSNHYSVYEFDSATGNLGEKVLDNKNYDVLDIALATEYQRPKKLPSEVDLQVKTGLLMCQDINFHGFVANAGENSFPQASRIEVMGIDSSYGIVPVEKDGSFYLKVLADKPFRIRSLDENNRVLSAECTWLWLRPNERRGCVGCHEDPETVPANRIPLAVKKDPVIIPVHITEIKEKSVELE